MHRHRTAVRLALLTLLTGALVPLAAAPAAATPGCLDETPPPGPIPGLPLSSVYEVQDLPVASLPTYYQAEVAAGIEVGSVDAARVTIAQLRPCASRQTPAIAQTLQSRPAKRQ